MDRYPILQNLNADLFLRKNRNTTILSVAAILGLVPLTSYCASCYREWHALGGGGLPRNFGGWLVNACMHLIARHDFTRVPPPYEKQIERLTSGLYGKAGGKSFFFSVGSEEEEEARGGRIPQRLGPRPDVPSTIAPQRQISQQGPASLLGRQNALLQALAALNPELFQIKGSQLESPEYKALWLAEGLPRAQWYFRRARGEFAHVHPEGSTHVTLSLVDAAEAIAKGWGQRHGLSGVRGCLPWGYIMVYAPREDEEEDWGVWREIVLASARFVARAAGWEGEVIFPPSH